MKPFRHRFICFTALITAAAFLCGCSSHTKTIPSPPESRISARGSDAADSSTVNAPRDNDELYTALEDAFLSEYILINNYTMHIGYTDAEDFILTRMRYVQKAKKIRELVPSAVTAVNDAATRLYGGKTVTHSEDIVYPQWQYLAATLIFADSEEFLLYNIMHIRITVAESDDSVSIHTEAKPLDIQKFAAEMSRQQADDITAANTYNSIRYTYAYLTALYDDEGNCLIPDPTAEPSPDILSSDGETTPEPVYYNFTEDYISQLVFPLDNVPAFRDSWAQGRSHNTRMHMGTDIVSHEGNNIYSCSSGTVICKGFDKIPGNFVIVLDDHGFEYHYYHLVEIPDEVNPGDRVQAGDIIAHVGDTGNSDVSHLHIAIIDPDGVFQNPYKLMLTLSQRKQSD